MPCELRIRDDLSVNDIVDLAKRYHVKATPHVGNWTPTRLALPLLGVSISCVDQTIGVRDINTHPQLFIQNGEVYELCDNPEQLTTHAVVNRAHNGVHQIGTSLSTVHVGVLRLLYPSASIITHTEELLEQQDIVPTLLEEVTNFSRSATWWRKVDAGGIVTQHRKKELPKNWREVQKNIFPITSKRDGWLVHNRVAILIDLITQSRMGVEPEIYHLSGPDMVHYLGGEIEIISRMYDYVRGRLSLPQEVITFNLIPFASFCFAIRGSQLTACERLCEELAKGCEGRGLKEILLDTPDTLANSNSKRYFTQHDTFVSGERVVIPEVARSWSMATCARYFASIQAQV